MEKELTKKRNWEELILESDTKVAYELLQAYKEGNIKELGTALEINYKNSVADAHIDLSRHLRYLMEAVILAKSSADYHTQEHWEKICHLRSNIEDDLEWNDCLNDDSVRNEWEDAFGRGKKSASIFVSEANGLKKIEWKEIFETIYHPKVWQKKIEAQF